jgi:hypothetical protein
VLVAGGRPTVQVAGLGNPHDALFQVFGNKDIINFRGAIQKKE